MSVLSSRRRPAGGCKEKGIIVEPRLYSGAQWAYITVKWLRTINVDDPMTHFLSCVHLAGQFMAPC